MQKDSSFVAYWLESEFSLNRDLMEMFGIDRDRFYLLELTKEKAGEGALDIVDAVISTKLVDMLVINSLKALVPSEEYEKEFSQSGVGVQARMNAKMSRKFAAPLAESNTSLVIITHLTTDIGSFGYDPYVISGGHGIIFASALVLDMRKRSVTDADPVGKEEAIKVAVRVKKNHCVPTKYPYVQAQYFAIINEGIEQYLSLIDKAIKQGVLIQAGAFIKDPDPDNNNDPKELEDGTRLQWQGRNNFRQYLLDNPKYFKELEHRVLNNVIELPKEEVEEIEKENEEVEKKVKDKKSK